VIIIATFLARTIVTFFAIILEADRGQIFIAKHCYILAIENSAKPFSLKKHKKLPSQTENYIFGSQSINFNYAAKTCISGKVFWQIGFWTFIFVHFEILEKLSNEKTRYFQFFKYPKHYIL
jgi:hypothetical protein